MNGINVLKRVTEPLGVLTRTFIADYRDDDDNYFNKDFYFMASTMPESDDEIAVYIISILEGQGYIVYSVYEILHGLSEEDLCKISPDKLKKHLKPIYFDESKEKCQ